MLRRRSRLCWRYLEKNPAVSAPKTPSGFEPPAQIDEVPGREPTQSAASPRVWTVFLTIVTAISLSVITQILVAAAVAGILIANGAEPKELAESLISKMMSPPVFIAMLVLGQLAIFVAAIVAAKLSPVPINQRIGLVTPRCPRWAHVVFVLGSALPLTLSVGAAYLVATVIEPDKSTEMLYDQMTSVWAVLFIVLIGLLPGICEEILFRGYIQRRFIDRWGPATGIIVTSIVFGLFHVTPHGIALATIIGVWLGVLAYRTGSIWSGIFCHAAINSGWNIWQVGKKLWGFPESPSLPMSVIGIAAMTLCFAVAIWVLATQISKPTDSSIAET